MNIDEITIGEAKQLANMFGGQPQRVKDGLDCQIGEYVIVRTYSAGAWFGKLEQKAGSEVILSEARRLWRFWCKKSISLSGVALYGLDYSKSKVCPPISKQWLEAIEIISMSNEAIENLKGCPDVEAE